MLNAVIFQEEKLSHQPIDLLSSNHHFSIHAHQILNQNFSIDFSIFNKFPIDIIFIHFYDLRDWGNLLIKKLKDFLKIPVFAIIHLQSELQLPLAYAFGVDEAMYAPCAPIELLSRCQLAIERFLKAHQTPETMKFDDLVIDFEKMIVIKAGVPINLTKTEFQILAELVKNKNKVLKKEDIYKLLWNDFYYDNGNALNVHMRRLRIKLEENPNEPKYILTRWGVGYQFGSS
jgi:two-component system response regulator RegX3